MRAKINHEQLPARFPAGTFDRIDAVLGPKETRTDLIRAAVDAEIDRRSAAAPGVPGAAAAIPAAKRKRQVVSDPARYAPAVAASSDSDDELAMVARAFRTFR